MRCVLDEVFGSENFALRFSFVRQPARQAVLLDNTVDDYSMVRQERLIVLSTGTLYNPQEAVEEDGRTSAVSNYPTVIEGALNKAELEENDDPPVNWKVFRPDPLTSQVSSSTSALRISCSRKCPFSQVRGGGKQTATVWTDLQQANRLMAVGNTLRYVRYLRATSLITTYNDTWDEHQTEWL